MTATVTESNRTSPSPDKTPVQAVSSGQVSFKTYRRSKKGWLVVFIIGIVLGVMIDRVVPRRASLDVEHTLPSTTQFLKPGPWGRLAKIPLTISAPEELLPVRALEAAGTRWFFGGFTLADLGKLLDTAEVTADQRAALLAPEAVHEVPNGLQVTPPDDVLLALSPDARLKIYRQLSRFPENRSQVSFIPASSVDEHLKESGVSFVTDGLFRQLSCQEGRYFIFSGLACILAKTEEYEEKVRFMKALTMQHTFLLRFHVDPGTDLNAMAAYWGKGLWSTDVKAILSSLARVPGGTWSSTLLLMPPLPTSKIYTYPVVADNPLNGAPVIRDCHWTSFNFFRDEPDPKFSDASYIKEKLRESYSPILGDPRYGDIVFFAKPDGDIIHSAVFMADDVVYTKNGDTFVHPWMLSTIPDLIEHYSFQVEPGEKLVVSYYRKKFD